MKKLLTKSIYKGLFSRKFVLAAVLFSLLSFGSGSLFAQYAHAQAGPTGPTSTTGGYVCDPAKFGILKLLDSFSTSIVSTALTHSETLSSIKSYYMAVGMAPAEAFGCINYMADNVPGFPGCFSDALRATGCAEPDPAICQSLINQYNIGGAASGYDGRAFVNGKVSGSLLGYAYYAQNVLKYEPVPVNTAYFFKDYLAKIPVIGETAYAQSYTDYGHTLINAVLNMWKVFRNIAYAIMAVIMLWVGFAIITRRRISSQTVVTVQYALPKIVIALVFIALSYPIGALITSFSWTLFNSSREIIISITGDARPAAAQNTACAIQGFSSGIMAADKLGVGGIATLINLIVVNAAGAGAMLALVSFVQIVVVGFMLFALLKALWIYLKMVIHTATAPIQIAIYALPGNDDRLELWFKQMVAWGAGIFSMSLTLRLVEAFSLDLIIQAFQPVLGGGNIGNAIVSGSLFNVFIAPMLMIFGAATAISMPNKIETMIMGKKGR